MQNYSALSPRTSALKRPPLVARTRETCSWCHRSFAATLGRAAAFRPGNGGGRRSLLSQNREQRAENKSAQVRLCSFRLVICSWPFFSTLRRVFAGSEGCHRSAGSSLNFRCFCYSAPSSLCAGKHTRARAPRQSAIGRSPVKVP